MDSALINEIGSQPWVVDYDRRLQCYGCRNELEKLYALVPFPVSMPLLMQEMAAHISERKLLTQPPDQVIITNAFQGRASGRLKTGTAFIIK